VQPAVQGLGLPFRIVSRRALPGRGQASLFFLSVRDIRHAHAAHAHAHARIRPHAHATPGHIHQHGRPTDSRSTAHGPNVGPVIMTLHVAHTHAHARTHVICCPTHNTNTRTGRIGGRSARVAHACRSTLASLYAQCWDLVGRLARACIHS
jgi:hypothetical protein